MDDRLVHSDASPLLTEIPRFEQELEPAYGYERPARPPIRWGWLNVALFLATLLTTTMAGAYSAGAPVLLSVPASLPNLMAGLPFSIPLMLIVFAHEMGHYLVCRHYRLPSTLPYFLPLPAVLGTLGAFIRIRAPVRGKRELFDVGVAGPFAGFVALLPFLVYGVARSQPAPLRLAASKKWLKQLKAR